MKVGGTAAYRTKTNRRCTRGGSLKFLQKERVVTTIRNLKGYLSHAPNLMHKIIRRSYSLYRNRSGLHKATLYWIIIKIIQIMIHVTYMKGPPAGKNIPLPSDCAHDELNNFNPLVSHLNWLVTDNVLLDVSPPTGHFSQSAHTKSIPAPEKCSVHHTGIFRPIETLSSCS